MREEGIHEQVAGRWREGSGAGQWSWLDGVHGDLLRRRTVSVQDLERIARIQEVKKRQPLYRPGDSSHNVYLLTQGRIILTNIGAGGSVVTLEILEPGDVFGELEAMEGASRDTAAEALDHGIGGTNFAEPIRFGHEALRGRAPD